MLGRITLRVQRDGRSFTVDVRPDGEGLVSHAGAALLAEAADRLGLTDALARALAPMRARRGRHDPGRVVRDLAVMLADGGDCLSDLRAVREQQVLFGAVASDATAFRVIDRVAADPDLLDALRAARARAREHAWRTGVAPGRIIIDVDATLISAHSEKDGAAGTFKRGFGFHPLLAYLDESREALAGVLRPGNAGANTAADHVQVVELALQQLPRQAVEDAQIVVRTDSAAATHELTDELRAARIAFLMGFDLTETIRRAILALPEAAWRPAVGQGGEIRQSAWVAEITDRLDLTGWPDGCRVIVRRERPHPGAQLSFTDHDGHRFLATLTDLAGNGRTGVPAPGAREHRGSHPRGQADRPCQPAVPRLRPQPGVARGLHDRPRPNRLDPGARAHRRARRLRAQDAALPAVAHRRPPRLPCPPRDAAPATHLALGERAGCRVRAPRGAATTRALTRAHAHDDQQHARPPAALIAARPLNQAADVPAGTPGRSDDSPTPLSHHHKLRHRTHRSSTTSLMNDPG